MWRLFNRMTIRRVRSRRIKFARSPTAWMPRTAYLSGGDPFLPTRLDRLAVWWINLGNNHRLAPDRLFAI